jgi:DHA1 family tetracycline resistance protein-like MFS transporter
LYSSFPLFCEAVLGMSAEQVGVQFFYIGIIAVTVQGFLIKPLTKLFREETLFLTGNILMVLGLFMIAFTSEVWHLTVYLIIMTLGNSLNAPTITSLLSKAADPSRVGTIMGAAQGLGGLGRTIGPTWGGALFGIAFGLPFAATAVVATLTIVAGLSVRKSISTPIK